MVAYVAKAGYLLPMALTAFCTTCQRTVYVDEAETAVCPVCSSPLLETVEALSGDQAAASEDQSQIGG